MGKAKDMTATASAAQLITVDMAARELGITPCRVRKLIYATRLKAVKLGGNREWLIDAADLEAVRERKPGRPGWQK